MKSSEQINELAAALVEAQTEITNAAKDEKNPHFQSTFASLPSVIKAIRPVLAKVGVAVIQLTGGDGAAVTVETMLLHSSGQWISEVATVTPDRPGPQPYGSCVTYLRRYGAQAIAFIGSADDDGEAATDHDNPPPDNPRPNSRPPESRVWAAAVDNYDPDAKAEERKPDWNMVGDRLVPIFEGLGISISGLRQKTLTDGDADRICKALEVERTGKA